MTAPRKSALVAAVVLALSLLGCSATGERLDVPQGAATPTGTSTSSPSTAPTAPATTGAAKGTSPDRLKLPVPNVKPKGFVDPPPGNGMERYVKQKVEWRTCGTNECAKIAVPLDYAHPDGQAITLALQRQPATKSPRLGTLFINPGGPGEPGTDMVAGFARAGLEGFDILGWDTRGSGQSTPVVCFGDKDADAYSDIDSSPDDEAEMNAMIAATKKFTTSCLTHSGPLLAHISTQDTARDLDLMRQLVGDPQLNYLGYSYGTYVGAVYAQLFPKNVGRLVLDSAVNITDDTSVIQAMGFDLALQHFASWCAKRSCFLGKSQDEVVARIVRFLNDLDANPITVGDRKLTQTLATMGVGAFLYGDEKYWEYLLQALQLAIQGRNGAALLRAGDFLNGREDDGTYSGRFYSFPAILCADVNDDGVEAAKRDWLTDQTKAPVFGKFFGPGLVCPLWAAQPAPKLHITAPGAKPILVVGATGDSATPYQQAVWMAKQLESGVLLTLHGEGHAQYGGKSKCIDQAVVKYLTTGTPPANGTTCEVG